MDKDIDLQGFLNGDCSYGAVGMHNLTRPLPDASRREEPVTAYHVLLTDPYLICRGEEEFRMRGYEKVTAELSARLWRRYNGPIYLLTDRRGAMYFREIGMDQFYDGVDSSLDGQRYCIDLKKFWAAGKVQALLQVHAPCAVIDLDMLVWQPLDLDGCQLAAAHTEPVLEWLYPPFSTFLMSPRYDFPKQWDPAAEPLNTSFVYFADEGFKDDYASQSIRFMRFERDTPDSGAMCMIFAEQRILAMCAAQAGISVKTFLEYGKPLDRQGLMTHIWEAKKLLHWNADAEKGYNALCRKKIMQLAEGNVP